MQIFSILAQSSADFTSLNATKDAKIYRRKACWFDSLTAKKKTTKNLTTERTFPLLCLIVSQKTALLLTGFCQ